MTEQHDPTNDITLDSPTWTPGARVGTHWATCWRDGGGRHHACAIARVEELEAQIARAEAATVAAMHTGDYAGVILPDSPAALYRRIGELEGMLADATRRAAALDAQLDAVPAYASYYAAAWEQFEADSDGPEPLDFDEWLAAGKGEGAHNG